MRTRLFDEQISHYIIFLLNVMYEMLGSFILFIEMHFDLFSYIMTFFHGNVIRTEVKFIYNNDMICIYVKISRKGIVKVITLIFTAL